MRLEIDEEAVMGDIKAGNSGGVLNLRRGLKTFFESVSDISISTLLYIYTLIARQANFTTHLVLGDILVLFYVYSRTITGLFALRVTVWEYGSLLKATRTVYGTPTR